jgi:hypothetical protein
MVGAALELLARLLVNVGTAKNGPAADSRGKRERSPNRHAGAAGGLHNLTRRTIKQLVIVSLEADSDLVGGCHLDLLSQRVK